MDDNSNESEATNTSFIDNYIVIEYDDEEILGGAYTKLFVPNKNVSGIKYQVAGKNVFDIKETIFQSNLKSPLDHSPSKLAKNREMKQENEGISSSSDLDLKTEQSDGYQFIGSFCNFCDFRPQQRNAHVLEVHMRKHTGDKPFSCSQCVFSTADQYYLEVHMRQHTGEKPFMCSTCEFKTSRKDQLKLHMLTHSDEKPVVACPECDFKCSRKKNLYQHWRYHCKFEHFRCSVCDYKCRQSIDFKNHMMTHPKVFSCPKCDYLGRCDEDLEKHSLIHNEITCNICGKSFKKKSNLKSHLELHGDFKYHCDKCNKSFKVKRSLSDHLKNHSDINICCKICNKSFESEIKFQKHFKRKGPCFNIGNISDPAEVCQIVHKYKCEQCPSTFKKKDHLEKHWRKHTGEKPFKCTICKFTTADKFCLKEHMMRHRNEKPFACMSCNFKCLRKRELGKHLAKGIC